VLRERYASGIGDDHLGENFTDDRQRHLHNYRCLLSRLAISGCDLFLNHLATILDFTANGRSSFDNHNCGNNSLGGISYGLQCIGG